MSKLKTNAKLAALQSIEEIRNRLIQAGSDDEVELSPDVVAVLTREPEEICKVKKKSRKTKKISDDDDSSDGSLENSSRNQKPVKTLGVRFSTRSRSKNTRQNSVGSNRSGKTVSEKEPSVSDNESSEDSDNDSGNKSHSRKSSVSMNHSESKEKQKDSLVNGTESSDADENLLEKNVSTNGIEDSEGDDFDKLLQSGSSFKSNTLNNTSKTNNKVANNSDTDKTDESSDSLMKENKPTDDHTKENPGSENTKDDSDDDTLVKQQNSSDTENESAKNDAKTSQKKDNNDNVKLPMLRIVPLEKLLAKQNLPQINASSDCITISTDESDSSSAKINSKANTQKLKKRKRQSDSDESSDSDYGSKLIVKSKKQQPTRSSNRTKLTRSSNRKKVDRKVIASETESDASESDYSNKKSKTQNQKQKILSNRRNENSTSKNDQKTINSSKKVIKISIARMPKDMNKLLRRHKLEEIRDENQRVIASKSKKDCSDEDDVPISTFSKNQKNKHKARNKSKTNDELNSCESENSEQLQDSINKILESFKDQISDDDVNQDKSKKSKNQNIISANDEDSDVAISSLAKRNQSPNKKQNRKKVDRSDNNSTDGDEIVTTTRRTRKKKKVQRILDDSDNSENDQNNSEGETSTRKMRKKSEPVSAVDASDSDNSSDYKDDDRPSTSKRKKNNSDSDDFEPQGTKENNSDSEDFQPNKRRRIITRKEKAGTKKRSDDDDDDDDDEDYGREKKKKPRRRRIKNVTDSSEDDEKGKKKGRKNIRKVLKNDDLEEETIQAAKEEQERKRRIEERQNMYNQMYNAKLEEVKELDKLVLDFNAETKQELVTVDRKLVKKLKPHQASGVKFMYDACFESIEKIESSDIGGGCILAHCMGLGKTLQVVALVHTLLAHSEQTQVEKILIICPVSTVLNWVNEFNMWLRQCADNKEIDIYEISRFKNNNERAWQIDCWHKDGGVLIMGYDMFRNLSSDSKRIRKKLRDQLRKALVDPGPDLVVCDEGHLLKNSKTSISKAVNQFRTLRRIVLTGTPLQNNLNEYFCMVQFVKPNLLGSYKEYCNRFVNPIINGQYNDSTPQDIQMMKRRSHILHKLLDGCVQRRDYSVLTPFLPPKNEYVVYVKLTKIQCELYRYYMEHKARRADSLTSTRSSVLFSDFQNLQRIWTHPRVLRYNSDRYEINARKKRDMLSDEEGSLKDFIDDEDDSLAESTPNDSSSSSSSDEDDVLSVNSNDKKDKKNNVPQVARRTRANAKDFSDPEPIEEVVEENPTEWWMPMCPEEELDNLEHSGKLMLLFSLLKECESIGDKILVFSQSLFSLDVIEHFLKRIDENTQNPDPNAKLAGHTGSWALGLDYFRLDGSTSIENRNAACKSFNREDNSRARLFLISTKAGGLGINLTAANRVVIFDVSWNPSHDIQSIFRVYRFGQYKPCYIYRFIALGTMEEKIYERQVTKLAIAKRVIDEHQIDRHYKETDLMELYKSDIEPTGERATPAFPKNDKLFAEELRKFENIIYKYHEHDSLLENKHEETLSKEEIEAAWKEYEYEKNRPVVTQTYTYTPRVPGSGPVTSNHIFGIRSDILLQLLNIKARKDYPDVNPQGISTIVPVLLKHLYETMHNNDQTFYQELLNIQNQMAAPPMHYNNYNNVNAAGSSNMVVNPYAQHQLPQQQQLIKDAQNRFINMNNGKSAMPSSNQVIEID